MKNLIDIFLQYFCCCFSKDDDDCVDLNVNATIACCHSIVQDESQKDEA